MGELCGILIVSLKSHEKKKGKEKKNREDLKKKMFWSRQGLLTYGKKIHEKKQADYKVDSIKIIIF